MVRLQGDNGLRLKNELVPDLRALVTGWPPLRRRWDVGKVFDEIKNKLGEKKAWGTGLVAKATQGHLVALTHNLLLVCGARLEREHGLENAAEDRRRQERHREMENQARRTGRTPSTLRTGLRDNLAEAAAVPRLAHLYAFS